MIRFALLLFIYIVAGNGTSLAQTPTGPKALNLPTPAKKVSVLPIPTTTSPSLGLLQGTPGTAIAPGVCPPGYLPQYCGMQAYGACSTNTPVYQCIGQARQMGAFAAAGCQLGDWWCMGQQQQMAAMGCPPGPMQGTCIQQMYQYRYQQQQRNTALIVLGAGAGAMLLPKLLSGVGDMGSASHNTTERTTNARVVAGPSYASEDAAIGPTGSGNLDACGNLPADVKRALKEAQDFRNACPSAKKDPTKQKMVINDYSVANPVMWIFNAEGTKCLGKTAVSYGTGGRGGQPVPCADSRGDTTPPGFHITAEHPRCPDCHYGPENSMSLVGLEEQGTGPRGILIHYGANPTETVPTSNGCSGVSCYQKVRQLLGYGSLVYNYFGDKSLANGCHKHKGMSDQPIRQDPSQCHPDTPIPTNATGLPDSGGEDVSPETSSSVK